MTELVPTMNMVRIELRHAEGTTMSAADLC